MEKLLYEASLEGNTIVLLELLQDNPLILDRLTLNRHGDVPLHIASMLGHGDFVCEILTRKPHLAMESDSLNHLPLHIASAKGHVEIVKSLVSANPETCLARDRDGGTPLHLAAIKGRSDVVKELVQAQPHAARVMTIRLLLLNTTIEVNSTNTNGETPLDILAQVPRDLTYQHIMLSLTRAGAVEAKPDGLINQIPINSRNTMGLDRVAYHHSKDGSTNYEDWLDRKRNSLMVAA
ncbi:ankyrin repeat-containing domain, PGG domain protein [Tanacetum coccineum]|uniref:Ankyrin repeat-containing domain, PGG domain protein n=1 Tax=Tanacetum coccineum TaxID=301880 RepID=A0ABQ4YG77_9ASTR